MHVRGCLSSQLCDKGPAANNQLQLTGWTDDSVLDGQGCSHIVHVRLLLEVKYAFFRDQAFLL